MAKWDVAAVYSATKCADGIRVDYDIEADFGEGQKRFPFTLGPDDTAPLAVNLRAYLGKHPVKAEDHVRKQPKKADLEARLQRSLKPLNLSNWVERFVITGEPIPADVLAKRAAAVATYNTFKDDPAKVPQDWTDSKYWGAE